MDGHNCVWLRSRHCARGVKRGGRGNGWCVLLALLFVAAVPAFAEAPPADTAAAMQLLKARCFSCHTDTKAKGGLVMTSLEKLLKGGDSGPALVPGEPEKSALIASLAPDADPHMPPKKQLPPEQIATLAAWVKAGAAWDADALISKPRTVALAPLPANYQPVLTVRLSPDAKKLAVGCGNELVVYTVGEKTLTLVARASAHPDPIQSLAWSADGTRIATGAFRRIVLWNAQELAAERVVRDELTDRITALHFTKDGDRLFAADGRIAESGIVRVVEVRTGTVAASWPAHADTIADLALSPDGKLLATAGADKIVKLWEVDGHKEVARIEAHTTQVLAVGFHPDGTQLVTGGADQQLKAWNVKTREQVMLLGKPTAAITGAVWVAGGPSIFAVTDAGGALRYTEFKAHSGAQSSDSGKERKYEAADITLHCLAASADGEKLFAGTDDGRILGWNKDGKLVINSAVRPTAATATAAATP